MTVLNSIEKSQRAGGGSLLHRISRAILRHALRYVRSALCRWAGAAIAALLLAVLPALAQEPSTRPRSPSPNSLNLQVVALKHLEAEAAARMIAELGLPACVSQASGDRIVLRGEPNELKTIAEQFLPLVDVPENTPNASEPGPEVIPIRHRNAEDVLHIIRGMTSNPRLTLDELNQLLIVGARAGEISAIRQLVEQVDRPTRSIRLHFFFIRAAICGGAGEADSALPPELATVAKSLSQNGFGRLAIMAPMVVSVGEGGQYRSEAVLNAGSGEGGESLRFEVKGQVRLGASAGAAHVALVASMGGKYCRDERSWQDTHFHLDTAVETKVGDFVILAAAPGSSASGDAVALALRVTVD